MHESDPRYVEEEARYVERARKQADIYERIHRRDGPGSATRKDRFTALVVDARTTTLGQVLAALVDFARPALAHAQLPEELWTWTARAGDWHVVFYGSSPAAQNWIQGEHLTDRIGTLEAYLHLEHDAKDFRQDCLVEFDGASLRELSYNHSDYFAAPEALFVAERRIEDNGPWPRVRARTGLGLGEIRAAIAGGAPVWLICNRVIVLAGVERNAVPVRRPRAAEPPAPVLPPEPDARFAAVSAEVDAAYVGDFERSRFVHARRLADAGAAMVDVAIAALARKGPKPRTSCVALATLGMLGGERAAAAIVPWLNKTSAPLRRAAIGALATMAEDARAALVAGAGSRKNGEKSACAGLLRVLDDPAYDGLRRVRAARAAVPRIVAKRLASEDLFAINMQDLDAIERYDARAALVREGGAGVAAWYLGWLYERSGGASRQGNVMKAEDVVSLLRDAPLGPWVVALLLLEYPAGEGYYVGPGSLADAADKAFGPACRTALRANERVGRA